MEQPAAKESTVIVLNGMSKVSSKSSQTVFRMLLATMRAELLILHSMHASLGNGGIVLPLLYPGGVMRGCKCPSLLNTGHGLVYLNGC